MVCILTNLPIELQMGEMLVFSGVPHNVLTCSITQKYIQLTNNTFRSNVTNKNFISHQQLHKYLFTNSPMWAPNNMQHPKCTYPPLSGFLLFFCIKNSLESFTYPMVLKCSPIWFTHPCRLISFLHVLLVHVIKVCHSLFIKCVSHVLLVI